MRKALYIFGELADEDVEWLLKVGVKTLVPEGQVLLAAGHPIDAIYVVLEGKFAIYIPAEGEKKIAECGTGEVLGELSFIDKRPPSATVTAQTEGQVLAISRDVLDQKLAEDHAFAARFYRALAIFLTDRLRDTTTQLGYGTEGASDASSTSPDELDLDRLHSASLGGVRMSRILNRLKDY